MLRRLGKILPDRVRLSLYGQISRPEHPSEIAALPIRAWRTVREGRYERVLHQGRYEKRISVIRPPGDSGKSSEMILEMMQVSLEMTWMIWPRALQEASSLYSRSENK